MPRIGDSDLPKRKKKTTIECPTCGKKYSSQEVACPNCTRSDSEDTARAKEPSTLSRDASGTPLEKEFDFGVFEGDADDLAQWLRGDDEDSSSIITNSIAGSDQETMVQSTRKTPIDVSDDALKKIEDWLHGDVDDVSPWLFGDTEAKAVEKVEEGQTSEIKEETVQIEADDFKQMLIDLKSGKKDIADIEGELVSLVSELNDLRSNKSALTDEVQNIRKGSTALAKYFKSIQGKEGDEISRVADELAKEMAAREELEFENLELRAKVKTLKERFEGGLDDLPADKQEIERIQLEIAENQRLLQDKEDFLRDKEKQLCDQEATTRQEMRERFVAELQEKISDFEKNEIELRAQLDKLKTQNKESEIELKHRSEEVELLSSKGDSTDILKTMNERLEDYRRLEKQLAIRDQEMQSLRDTLGIKEEELNSLKEPMKYKEDELINREEDLLHREKILEEELRRLEQAKSELGSQDEIELKKRLEQLQDEITTKEEEILSKEKYFNQKEEELKFRERALIDEEIEEAAEERSFEFKIEKVKTGIRRLDDLLIGGYPFGTNVLIYGPAFTGKDIFANLFAAEGLKKGVPVIWVTTEKTPPELREEMRFIMGGFEEYEKKGLVRFVDIYSRSMGDEAEDPNVYYVESPTDFKSLQIGIDDAAKELMKNFEYYRFVFRSISTMIAYLDTTTAFKMLNPIVGRRKRDKSVGVYVIEKGMHGEQEIQMVGSLMDGMLEFKVENLNTFLSVKGIGEVQSRAWIRYTSTKSSVNVGSFALDHIR